MGSTISLSNIGKNNFNFSTGTWAKQAGGSVSVSYGDTVVLTTVCMSGEPKPDAGFFPLFVEYQEKTYAMGKIPGGFFKKEGRPKDSEILTARLIDRPVRPLFPSGLTHEVQIVAMVLSSDGENSPDVLAINAASAALMISDIPFSHAVAAVRVGQVAGKFIVNPTYEERQRSPLDLVVVGTEESIVMLEGGFDEVGEAVVIEAVKFAHPFIKHIIAGQKDLVKKAGKKKRKVPLAPIDKELVTVIKNKVSSRLEKVYGLVKKEEREEALADILSSAYEGLAADNPELTLKEVKNAFFSIEEEFMRKNILEKEKRPDGRGLSDIRALDCQVRVLPRTHGSATFTRGQTQALAITTLGTSSDEQSIEALAGKHYKHFMLHYLFPPFSVGEIKPLRGPSRRDIGHGALAEKALAGIIPSKEEFPYTIRIVSEILESNGSSSMATVCAATLSLMDTGVPIKEPVAGIAMGLVKEGKNYKILTDIAGIEDHYGDMDFKVAGTKNGITAIQLDIKIDGLDYKIIEDALTRARQAREFILTKMNEALSLPREAVSQYAPKIKAFKIDRDKIGEVIGPGGRMIRRLTRENNVNIDIDDETSTVSVIAERQEDLEKTVNQIVNLTRNVELGDVYEDARIERLASFGAFCEIAPGKSALIRISEVSDKYVKDIREVLKEGDIVKVKVINIDPQGKIAVSIKQAK